MEALRQRQPAVKNKAYMGWIARLPCCACLVEFGRVNREVQVCHLRAPSVEHGKRQTGKAEKPSDKPWSFPLCMAHHLGDRRITKLTQHHMAELDFFAELEINPFEMCLALGEAYDLKLGGAGVISRFATKRMGR